MSVLVRSAEAHDLAVMAAMAAELVRFHHAIDPQRFILPRGVEEGYRQWFGRELASGAILLVAHREPEDQLDGYCYGRIEGRDWNMLLDKHAALHDVFVRPEARGSGAGEALVLRFCAIAKERGAPRVVLSTATSNQRAQALFTRCGFRPTMLEMTRELDD